jgi:hypothetical protein
MAKGDLAAAEALCREALEGRRETLGNRHPHMFTSINSLGGLLLAKGDLAAAEPLLREAVEGLRATLGSGHPDTLASIGNLRRLLVRSWLGSTHTSIASCSRRSPPLDDVSVTAALFACSAIVCMYVFCK